jgi:hypothetical protein
MIEFDEPIIKVTLNKTGKLKVSRSLAIQMNTKAKYQLEGRNFRNTMHVFHVGEKDKYNLLSLFE